MATKWYCNIKGRVRGPMSGPDLLDLVRRGDVVADTPIRKDDSKWFSAEEVGGLFEAARRGQPGQSGSSQGLAGD